MQWVHDLLKSGKKDKLNIVKNCQAKYCQEHYQEPYPYSSSQYYINISSFLLYLASTGLKKLSFSLSFLEVMTLFLTTLRIQEILAMLSLKYPANYTIYIPSVCYHEIWESNSPNPDFLKGFLWKPKFSSRIFQVKNSVHFLCQWIYFPFHTCQFQKESGMLTRQMTPWEIRAQSSSGCTILWIIAYVLSVAPFLHKENSYYKLLKFVVLRM